MKKIKPIPRKSGFAMARIAILLISLSSCSANINLTAAQKEQKKLDRFNITAKQVALYSAGAFVSYGLGKQIKKPNN